MCYVCSSVLFDDRMLVLQMSQWRGGHLGRGGKVPARATERGIVRSAGSRLGSTYSVSGPQVRCAGRVVSVWSGEHVRACVSHMIILVILL